MATHKLFDVPHSHDAEFYRDREPADHIHQTGHRTRLMRALADTQFVLDMDPECKDLCDLGCGTGGFLSNAAKRWAVRSWGYDLSPQAVQFAKIQYEVDARHADFVNDEVELPTGIAVLTETLEHLVDPPAMLHKLARAQVRWIVASVPLGETRQSHYEHHLWAWDGKDFPRMFAESGFAVAAHYGPCLTSTQHLIAFNPKVVTL